MLHPQRLLDSNPELNGIDLNTVGGGVLRLLEADITGVKVKSWPCGPPALLARAANPPTSVSVCSVVSAGSQGHCGQ